MAAVSSISEAPPGDAMCAAKAPAGGAVRRPFKARNSDSATSSRRRISEKRSALTVGGLFGGAFSGAYRSGPVVGNATGCSTAGSDAGASGPMPCAGNSIGAPGRKEQDGQRNGS